MPRPSRKSGGGPRPWRRLDRAKTAFFSNVSHEFRTPLTLMLGPVEDALAEHRGPSPPSSASGWNVVHRNALRLLKLVNTLLDFSRIEAGRVQAIYEPTDLAAFTADLASVFRSAVERAGLRLVVDCPPLAEPVYVDRDMWEKVVLNLLSNAFKFTLRGRDRRRAAATPATRVELTVRDTGTGIPAERAAAHLRAVPPRRGRARPDARGDAASAWPWCRSWSSCTAGRSRVESVVGRGHAHSPSRIPLGIGPPAGRADRGGPHARLDRARGRALRRGGVAVAA